MSSKMKDDILVRRGLWIYFNIEIILSTGTWAYGTPKRISAIGTSGNGFCFWFFVVWSCFFYHCFRKHLFFRRKLLCVLAIFFIRSSRCFFLCNHCWLMTSHITNHRYLPFKNPKFRILWCQKGNLFFLREICWLVMAGTKLKNLQT